MSFDSWNAEAREWELALRMGNPEALRYVTEEEKAALDALFDDILGWRERHPLAAALVDEMRPSDVLKRHRDQEDVGLLGSFAIAHSPVALGHHRQNAEEQQRKRMKKGGQNSRAVYREMR
jgi:hypothetical protein